MADLKVGNDTVIDVKVGTTQINAVYVGTTLIWSSVPNIDFKGEWTTPAVDDVWDFDESEPGADVFRIDTPFSYVQLTTDVGKGRMSLNAATAAELTPNTSYRLTVEYDRQAFRSPLGVTIGNVAAGTLSETDTAFSGDYLYEATFTTDSGSSTDIEFFCDAIPSDNHFVRIISVTIERA